MTDKSHTLIDYYTTFNERDRLTGAWGELEFIRTLDILRPVLPPPPARILDVGGAAGRYACLLARDGYAVTLIDPVPKHIDQAREASAEQPDFPLSDCRLGDARDLDVEDHFADAVLLMGPLYHLQENVERLAALREARRALKPGGKLFAAGISRFASCLDGLLSVYIEDPDFREIIRRDLDDGRHHNPTDNPLYFTDTYFHKPEDLQREVKEAGFRVDAMHAVEGIGCLLRDFEKNWGNPQYREMVLEIVRETAREPSLLGASPHILCTATRES